MDRDQVLSLLLEHKTALQLKYGIEQIGVFGSTARDERTGSSDIDIVIVSPPDIYQLVHIKDELEALLRTKIDLVRYSKYMFTPLRKRIDSEAIYV